MTHSHGIDVLGVTEENRSSSSSGASASTASKKEFFAGLRDKVDLPSKEDLKSIAFPTSMALGVTGALLWKQHPVLGFISGSSIGANGVRLLNGDVSALGDLASTHAGVYTSLAWKSHPVLGYLGGHVLVDMAISGLKPAVAMARGK